MLCSTISLLMMNRFASVLTLILLNINVQDTGKSDPRRTHRLAEDILVFKPSDFAIINTDGSADFDTESKITLRDTKDRKLDLRLNYV